MRVGTLGYGKKKKFPKTFAGKVLRTEINAIIHYVKSEQKDRTAHQERSVRVAERLALPTSDHGVTGSNPAGGEILPEPKRRFIAQSLSCSPFHRLEMTKLLSKGRKTLTHPSISIKRKEPVLKNIFPHPYPTRNQMVRSWVYDTPCTQSPTESRFLP